MRLASRVISVPRSRPLMRGQGPLSNACHCTLSLTTLYIALLHCLHAHALLTMFNITELPIICTTVSRAKWLSRST